jgi:hypothetical protein
MLGDKIMVLKKDTKPVSKNSVNFMLDNNEEVMSIRQDGFYVRGVKVEQNEDEAKKVYDTFCEWLSKQDINK